ncbi:hypothetical protein KIN20_010628 [Parelaphostrongylus tenuis]|uniref:SCP domain-containing protein n=1 Tax=Parelaphostrongylus tenuis TaxID=148309 RepID=A0AAD5QIY4_PARTN|nr:hypothetical protein KIN20_010628 [Parelaphostrongylus tenuis]
MSSDFFQLLQCGLCGEQFQAPFGCAANSSLNDANRTAALATINKNRLEAALGQKQLLPPATHMNKLAWNCTLEEIAQRLVDGCPPRQNAMGNGFNYLLYQPPFSTPAHISYPLQYALFFWTLPQTMWLPNNTYTRQNNGGLTESANMIRANTTAVGCAAAFCGNLSAAACVFSDQ